MTATPDPPVPPVLVHPAVAAQRAALLTMLAALPSGEETRAVLTTALGTALRVPPRFPPNLWKSEISAREAAHYAAGQTDMIENILGSIIHGLPAALSGRLPPAPYDAALVSTVPGEAESSPRAAGAYVALLVLYCADITATRDWYATHLGLDFAEEQHEDGPVHVVAVLADGCVLELYPARDGKTTTPLRIGITVLAASLPTPGLGRRLLRDPDQRTVEIIAV